MIFNELFVSYDGIDRRVGGRFGVVIDLDVGGILKEIDVSDGYVVGLDSAALLNVLEELILAFRDDKVNPVIKDNLRSGSLETAAAFQHPDQDD